MIDWSYWANLAVVPYADACILSHGFDPRVIKGNALPRELDAELRRRESIARSHLGRDLPSHQTEADRYCDAGKASGVKLAEFRAWAESLPSPFTFPDEFPRPASATKAATSPAKSQGDKALSARERNNLLRIIRALDAMNQLPEKGYAESVRAMLDTLGLAEISDDTIRKVIESARKIPN